MESDLSLMKPWKKVQVVETRVMRRPKVVKVDEPDGCLAWGVALAACLINFIMAGLGRMSGILYVAFIEMFNISRGSATAPFSVRSSTRNLLGPVVGILGQQYGVRAVTIAGGVIGTISSASCYFASDITWITIIWGGINGVGTALTTTLPQVVIGQYFEKHRTTAAGLAFSGGCVGSFLFPVLIEYLLHLYGLPGTFLIMSGIIMHVIPAAMLLRKPPWLRRNGHKLQSASINQSPDVPSTTDEKTNDNFKANGVAYKINSDSENQKYDEMSNEQTDEFKLTRDKRNIMSAILFEAMKFLSNNPKCLNNNHGSFDAEIESSCKRSIFQFLCKIHYIIDKENTNNFKGDCPRLNGCTPDIITSTELIKAVEIAIEELNNEAVLNEFLVYVRTVNVEVLNPLTTEQIRSVIVKLIQTHENFKCEEFDAKQNGVIVDLHSNFSYEEGINIPNENVEKPGYLESIKIAIKLNLNPIFHMICLCRAIHFITFIPVVTVAVDFGMDKGLPEEDGKYIIAALSAGDLVGRLGLGWVTDKGFVKLPTYMLLTMILQGATTACLPWMNAKWSFLTAIGIFGLLQGSVFIRHPVLVTKYMTSNEQSIAMGCINFLSGFLGFGLPAYIGYFRDTLGSYDQMFYITGALGSCVGLLWIFEPQFSQCISNQRRRNQLPEK